MVKRRDESLGGRTTTSAAGSAAKLRLACLFTPSTSPRRDAVVRYGDPLLLHGAEIVACASQALGVPSEDDVDPPAYGFLCSRPLCSRSHCSRILCSRSLCSRSLRSRSLGVGGGGGGGGTRSVPSPLELDSVPLVRTRAAMFQHTNGFFWPLGKGVVLDFLITRPVCGRVIPPPLRQRQPPLILRASMMNLSRGILAAGVDSSRQSVSTRMRREVSCLAWRGRQTARRRRRWSDIGKSGASPIETAHKA